MGFLLRKVSRKGVSNSETGITETSRKCNTCLKPALNQEETHQREPSSLRPTVKRELKKREEKALP